MKINLIPCVLLLAAACTSTPDKQEAISESVPSSEKEQSASTSAEQADQTAPEKQEAKKDAPPMEEKTIRFLPPVVTDEPPVVNDVREDRENTHDVWNEPAPKSVEKIEKAKEPEIYAYVDEPAEFPGGSAAFKKYITDNLVYPEMAKELGLEGKCYVQFIVSTKGTISNVQVRRGVPDCPECDKEAIRLMKGMPDWTPAKVNGKAVNSTFNYPVAFKLQ